MKKLLCLFLSIAMVFSLVPAPALAQMEELAETLAEDSVELGEGGLEVEPEGDAEEEPVEVVAESDVWGTYTDKDGVAYELQQTAESDGLIIRGITLPDKDKNGVALEPGSLDVTIPKGKVTYVTDKGETRTEAVVAIDAYGWGGTNEARDAVRSVTIPNTITIIVGGLFNWRRPNPMPNLQTVTFEAADNTHPGVTELSEGFFAGSTFTSVTLPTNLRAITKKMFEGCYNLKSLELPSTVETIGEEAFRDCTSLVQVSLNEGLKSIDKYAFYGHGVQVPVAEIAFPNSLETIGDHIFFRQPALKKVSFGTSLTESHLKTIGDSAFEGTSLEEVSIPDSVETIGTWAFAVCGSELPQEERHATLRSVTLGSSQEASELQSIGEWAFKDSVITTVSLPNKLTNYGGSIAQDSRSAFANLSELSNVDWPTRPPSDGLGLTHVYGFDHCPKLSPSIVEKLPPWITVIDDFAFHNSFHKSGGTSITIDSWITSVGNSAFSATFDRWDQTTPQISSIIIEEGDVPLTIGTDAFDVAGLLGKEVVLPQRIVSLGNYAFGYDSFYMRDPGPIYYVYNKDVQFEDGTVPWSGKPTIYYPEDAAEDSPLIKVKTKLESEGHVGWVSYTFLPFSTNPERTITGTVPQGAKVSLFVNGQVSKPKLVDGTGFSATAQNKSYVKAVVSLEGYADYTAQPGDNGRLLNDWDFSVGVADMTPLSTTGELVVNVSKTCRPESERIAAAIGCNVAVFDRSGRLVASGKTPTSLTFIASELPADTYTVIAFDKNDYFSSISSEADFNRMGATQGSWARQQVTIVAGETSQITLDIPDLQIAKAADILESGGVVVTDSHIVPEYSFFARVEYQMKDGYAADRVQVSIPQGMVPTSAASLHKTYGIGGYDGWSHVLTLTDIAPGDQGSATFYVGLKAVVPGTYAVNATVASGASVAPVGSISMAAPELVLEVPSDELDSATFKVHVYAAPGTDVYFRINDTNVEGEAGEPLALATNKVGHGTTSLTIPQEELGEFSHYSVTAYTLDDKGAVAAEAAQAVTYDLVQATDPTTEVELSFVHANKKVYLVKDGEDLGNVWYSCVAVPKAHPDLYFPNWPFKSVLRSEHKLENNATLALQMLNGDLRYENMVLTDSKANGDGTTTYTYMASVPFGDGNIEHDLTAKDIPFRFEVMPIYAEQDDDYVPTALTQENIDVLKGMWLRRAQEMVPGYDDDETSLTGTTSITTADLQGLTLDDDPQTGVFRYAPKAYAHLKNNPLEMYYDSADLIFNQGYKHQNWDPKGEVWNQLSEADRQTVTTFEDSLTNFMDCLQEYNGNKKPMYAYGSLEEYLKGEFGYSESNSVPDPKALERQGYKVVYDKNAGADDPKWYAVRITERETEAAAQDDEELLDAQRTEVKNGRVREYVDYNPVSDVECLVAFQNNMRRIAYEARDIGLDAWDKVGPSMAVTAAGCKNFDSMACKLDFAISKDACLRLSAAGSFALNLLGLPFTMETIANDMNSLISHYNRQDEIKTARKELREELKNIKANGGENTNCAAALQWESDELDAFNKANEKCIAILTLDVVMTSEIQAVGIWTAAEKLLERWGVELGAAGAAQTAAGQAFLEWLRNGKNVFGVAAGWTAAELFGIQDSERTMAYRRKSWIQAHKARIKQCKKDHIPQHGTTVGLDPSGYVFEAVEGNRISGVTATVQYKDGENWIVWDAENYEQVNNQITDESGVFAWDVPQGLWRVLYAKDGYEATQSAEMEVPPARMGLAIPIVSTLAPRVESVTADNKFVEVVFGQYMRTDAGSMPKVTMAGTELVGATWADRTPVSAADATEYARVLRVAVPKGTNLGGTLPVTVAGAINYAGKLLDPAWSGDVKIAPRPSKIVLDPSASKGLQQNYGVRVSNEEGSVTFKVGTSCELAVRVLDDDNNPVVGAKVAVSAGNAQMANAVASGVATDSTGTTKVQVNALLPGQSVITLYMQGTSLLRAVTLVTTLEDIITFVDVTDKTAHHEDIDWLAAAGISQGWVLADGTREFRPLANVARADMAAFLFRLAKGWGVVDDSWQPAAASPFSDVTEKTAHYREIMWLAESGISKGWSMADGTVQFRPYANVARADMAAFLARLWRLAGGATEGSGSFIDVTAKTAHAEDIAWLAASGVSKGWSTAKGAEFRPLANVARADMAAFLHRLDGLRG